MQQIKEKEMDKLIAYGGKDGIYYMTIEGRQYVVAKVKNGKVYKVREFPNVTMAKEWAET